MAYVALFIALDIVLYFISIFFQCMPASMAVCVFCVNIDSRKSQRLGGRFVLMFTEFKWLQTVKNEAKINLFSIVLCVFNFNTVMRKSFLYWPCSRPSFPSPFFFFLTLRARTRHLFYFYLRQLTNSCSQAGKPGPLPSAYGYLFIKQRPGLACV